VAVGGCYISTLKHSGVDRLTRRAPSAAKEDAKPFLLDCSYAEDECVIS